ncbi:4Fe-4S binding protein [Aquabacterium sp.]|uniref:4Fe-4S binding protein n=1 Tax=Aquabacterium sp. TaxID=1872578 RepID=UPI0025C37BB3|nr:4Fe-4S binding protein [Aquabacterium sp.]
MTPRALAPLIGSPLRALQRALMWLCLLTWASWLAPGIAHAGVMDAAAMQRAFPAPFIVGAKDTALPVWPLFRRGTTDEVLVGYAFESIDFAPLPGFSGTPMNVLVLLDAKGVFLDLQLISQHEPVFVEGLGPVPLLSFIAQHKGISLKQHIKVGSNLNRAGQAGSSNVYIDGVAKATASVRIVNQSIVAAALAVARAKLGFAASRDPSLLARVEQTTPFQTLDWPALFDRGLAQSQRWLGRDVDKAFAGTATPRDDSPQAVAPDALHSELLVSYLNLPDVGRNLMKPEGWARLLKRLEPGDHALLVASRGPHGFMGDDFVRAAVPDRLSLRQGELPMEIRDMDIDDAVTLPTGWEGASYKVFRVIGAAGLDPAQAMSLSLRVTRLKGVVYPERVSQDFTLAYRLPEAYVSAPAGEQQDWRSSWTSRAWELGVLGAGLLVLSAMLWRPSWLVRDEARMRWLRNAYLVYTIGFIGFFAQGQLSIVNLTGVVQAIVAGRSLGFLLYDPMTVVLWAYVALTLLVWGRGTFCGWLCPFGALQDLISQLAKMARVRQRPLHRDWDRRFKRLKYGVLAVILGLAAIPGSALVDSAVEAEPFKTAITLGFVRHWPFVLWAVAMLGLSAVVYKGYCRYVCPLGAALAVMGRLRRWNWIPRRAECGTPCQTCRHRCSYQAIEPSGAVDYTECFQCMDCVAIHDSDTRCAPLISARKAKVIPIQPLKEST